MGSEELMARHLGMVTAIEPEYRSVAWLALREVAIKHPEAGNFPALARRAIGLRIIDEKRRHTDLRFKSERRTVSLHEGSGNRTGLFRRDAGVRDRRSWWMRARKAQKWRTDLVEGGWTLEALSLVDPGSRPGPDTPEVVVRGGSERQMEILHMLARGWTTTQEQLARAIGMSARTVSNEIAAAKASGAVFVGS